MSCWQSIILLLYHREKALPCVRPVGPIYGPIACNVLKLMCKLYRAAPCLGWHGNHNIAVSHGWAQRGAATCKHKTVRRMHNCKVTPPGHVFASSKMASSWCKEKTLKVIKIWGNDAIQARGANAIKKCLERSLPSYWRLVSRDQLSNVVTRSRN